MENIIEFVSCILDIVIIFIYFNGILDRKENIGKLFFVYFCAAVVLNVLRTSLFLPFAACRKYSRYCIFMLTDSPVVL